MSAFRFSSTAFFTNGISDTKCVSLYIFLAIFALALSVSLAIESCTYSIKSNTSINLLFR